MQFDNKSKWYRMDKIIIQYKSTYQLSMSLNFTNNILYIQSRDRQ